MRGIGEPLDTKISSFQNSPHNLCLPKYHRGFYNMKRKNDTPANGTSKKRAISDSDAEKNFRAGLFDSKVLQDYTQQYAKSAPYDLNCPNAT